MSDIPAVVAVNKINGKILPGTIFTPDSAEQLAELEKLGAVRAPSDAEVALHEKMQANAAAAAKGAKSSKSVVQQVVETAEKAIEAVAEAATGDAIS